MSGNAAKQLTAYKKGISPSAHLAKFKTPAKLPAEGASKVKAPKKRVQVVESAVESVATAEQYGVFKGSTMYDLGGGCAVLALMHKPIEMLLSAAVDYVSEPGVLEYDRQFKMVHVCTRHRGEGFFSNKIAGYAFSKGTVTAKPLHPTLAALLDEVNKLVPGDPFSAIFVNDYRDEYDSIGKHSDKDVADDETVGVIAVSYGVSRNLRFRPLNASNTELKMANIPTTHGQTLVMHGANFQKLFSHEIVGKDVKKRPAPPSHPAALAADAPERRVSFTFRRHHSA
jgi:alkylated DNA repair dioxygenase AlkB